MKNPIIPVVPISENTIAVPTESWTKLVQYCNAMRETLTAQSQEIANLHTDISELHSELQSVRENIRTLSEALGGIYEEVM